MSPDVAELWRFLPVGYAISVALELPVLLVGLSPRHALARRFFAGFWLTACTYPIVVLVLPFVVPENWGRAGYLTIAETFAPVAECLLFWLAFRETKSAGAFSFNRDDFRDGAAIIVANLVSFLVGGWLLSIYV